MACARKDQEPITDRLGGDHCGNKDSCRGKPRDGKPRNPGAYRLMTNHIHLVAVPQRKESLGLVLRDAHTVYAMYFNRRTELSGRVWQEINRDNKQINRDSHRLY